MTDIPQIELDTFISEITSHPEYLDTEYVTAAYRDYCGQVIEDPFAEDVSTPIKRALSQQTPLSVIRIGDAEANLITYGVYDKTSNLDRLVFMRAMNQNDSFELTEEWMIALRDLITGAIAQADMIGVLGIWRVRKPSVQHYIEQFMQDHRGFSGHWRGIDYMLKLAGRGYFYNRIIAPAHLYLSVLEHLDNMLPLARRIIVISSRHSIVGSMQRKYPALDIEFIPVGDLVRVDAGTGLPVSSSRLPNTPSFVSSIFSALPHDLRGCLCLIGAGIWAGIYSTWIKQRGGVAVDLGSGFDLMDGRFDRLAHKAIGFERLRKYQL